MLFSRLDDLEVFSLRVTVPWVTLSDVRELDVEKVAVFGARHLLDPPVRCVDGGASVLQYLGGAKVVDFLYEELPVLTPPAAVAGETAGCGAPPVHLVLLLVPVEVVTFTVGHFVGPVPGRGVEDVLVGADFALGEDGEEVVHDVVGVGPVEEAEAVAEGRREADVREGRLVGYEA